MKSTHYACLFMLSLILHACNKNIIDEIPEIKAEELKESVYLLLHKEDIEFKVFKGSINGGNDISKTEKPESYWNQTKLIDLKYDTLIVRNDSIFERPAKYEKNNFRFRISNDTIYQWNRYAEFWALYGLKKGDTIEHFGSFYAFQKTTLPSLFAENGHGDGLFNSSRYFSDNEYLFKSPNEMKSDHDLATWYNVKYVYKKIDSKSK